MSQSPSLRGSGRFEEQARREAKDREVSIPFIAGQWSLRLENQLEALARLRSQSPSLRGSGRFSRTTTSFGESPAIVSIPFIAGQWSLLKRLRHILESEPGLNPLHCGAVVASDIVQRADEPTIVSQSPSLRGSGRFDGAPPSPEGGRGGSQSPSLRGSGRFAATVAVWRAWAAESQSPSLRGSGRFEKTLVNALRKAIPCLNPLHCGAVVASRRAFLRERARRRVSIPFIAGQWSLRREARGAARHRNLVSIPFIAGQWSLPERGRRLENQLEVSIPFIAGQWSLRCGQRRRRRRLRVSIPFIAGQWSLHAPASRVGSRDAWVSIPFIAGQWSLPGTARSGTGTARSLNPLHCGAVVASADASSALHAGAGSQSPSLRGSGRFPPAAWRRGKEETLVSIPFIAGQWSLPEALLKRLRHIVASQSPSLRGSGRFG